MDLECWGGKKVETAVRCPLHWWVALLGRGGAAWGWGGHQGHDFILRPREFKMKDLSSFRHLKVVQYLFCVSVSFSLLNNFLWMNESPSELPL